MQRHEFFPPSPTIDLDGIVSFLPVSKERQEPSFEDGIKKAYENFPELKMHADLHPSEYKNAIDLINELPVQLQDKWRLLKLCLWYQYGPSIFGVIFNLTPDETSKETLLLSDLPDQLTSKVSKLLEESNDVDEKEIAGNITSESLSKRNNIRVNLEKREFVILAEGGQRWNMLTPNQRLVLEARHLVDHPDTLRDLSRRLRVNHHQEVDQIEVAGLSKLGFFGEPMYFTRQQFKNLFKNAAEEDINSLTPKERELLERLYGVNAQAEHSYPAITSAAADIKTHSSYALIRHHNAMQKLLHTKRPIRIDMSISPTSEQAEFMRQQLPLRGVYAVAKDMGISQGVVRGWQRREGIKSRPEGRPPISPSPEELEFIKTNYPNKGSEALGEETGLSHSTIISVLRNAGIPIRKRGRPKKISS